MFNECLIHLCDCTWLNMLHMLKYMLIKHKKNFKCFSCFWKMFLFWKMSKISKNVQPSFGDLPHGSSQSHAPVASLYRRFLWLTGGSRSQSRKRLRKFFKIFGFWSFSWLIFATCSRVKAPVASLHKSFRDSLVGESPSREKELDKVFKISYKGF